MYSLEGLYVLANVKSRISKLSYKSKRYHIIIVPSVDKLEFIALWSFIELHAFVTSIVRNCAVKLFHNLTTVASFKFCRLPYCTGHAWLCEVRTYGMFNTDARILPTYNSMISALRLTQLKTIASRSRCRQLIDRQLTGSSWQQAMLCLL